jgi:uncharacterized repeat protein (TIGR01451 family)
VTATNAVGTSAASAPSNSVTPVAPATVPSAPTATDVQVTASATSNQVGLAKPFSYILQVKNNGSTTAANVKLTHVLHAGETFLAASPGCSQAAGVVTCQIGNLPRGSTSFLAIGVRAPSTPGTYTDGASVVEANLDPRPANNSASVTVQAR